MSITTLSTIRPGPAELSDWMLILDDEGSFSQLVRVILDLQRFTLVELESGGLRWIPKGNGLQFIATEPADEQGISPVAKALEAVRVRESLREAMLETVHRSSAMGLLDEPSPESLPHHHFPGFVIHSTDFSDDPGTPPDLR